MLEFILVLNTLWFALGFHAFSIRNHIFAKLLVPPAHRDNQAFAALIASGQFLGGFNLAFAVLNILLLFNIEHFDQPIHWISLLIANAVAHGSQFAFNLPIAIQNRKGEGAWQVLSGTMLFVFIGDLVMFVLNFSMGILQFFL